VAKSAYAENQMLFQTGFTGFTGFFFAAGEIRLRGKIKCFLDPSTIFRSYPGEMDFALHYREFHRALRGRQDLLD
jgi:hypothetical protein